MSSFSRALVTGADGLLGSHLVRGLLDRGLEVRALIQPGSVSTTLDGLDIERVSLDLASGGGALGGALAGCDSVFHCAAVTDMWADPDVAWRVNLEGTGAVLDACLEAGAGRLVHVGSASSFGFGPRDDPGDETRPFPQAYRGIAYMESKHRAMELVMERSRRDGLDAVVVAPTFLLGEFDFRPSGGELIRQFVKRGLKYVSRGGRNFAYAGDVAACLIGALETGESGQAYIAGGENLTYLDFFTVVARLAGVPPPRSALPRPAVIAAGALGSAVKGVTGRRVAIDLRMARISCCETYYDSGKARAALGMPRTPMETAVSRSLESLKEYGHIG